MEQQEPETPSQQRAPTPLRITERTLGHGLMAALAMQYAIGRSTLELTRIATDQQLAWLEATTDTDQQDACRAVESGVDAMDTAISDAERTVTQNLEAVGEGAADLADASTTVMESTFDVLLDTVDPYAQPRTHRV